MESLRGIAALTVVLFHAQGFGHASFLVNNAFVLNGYLMVDLFFVLSGFVIAFNYIDRIQSIPSLVNFQFKRFLRLYPLHLSMLFVFVGIEIAKYAVEVKTGTVANDPAFSKNDLFAFFNNIFLTHSFLEGSPTFNYPSWSISTEFYTYALFGVAVFVTSSHNLRIAFSATAIVVSGFIIYATNAEGAVTGVAIFRCIYAFMIGVLLYYLFRLLDRRQSAQEWVVYVALLVTVVAVAFGDRISSLVHPFIFAGLIFALLWSGEGKLKSVLSARWLVFMGTISYGIYMIHKAVWWGFHQIIRFALDAEELPGGLDGEPRFLIDGVTGTVLIAVGIAIILVASYASYRLIEMPATRIGQRFARAEVIQKIT